MSNKNQNKNSQNVNQEQKPKANSEIKPKDDGKSVLLKFEKDAFYNGQLVYAKGVHRVETANGWASRWMSRGAFVVDSMTSEATGSVAIEVPPAPPQDLGQGDEGQNADNTAPNGDTGTGEIAL